jgi:hypothetical protein
MDDLEKSRNTKMLECMRLGCFACTTADELSPP